MRNILPATHTSYIKLYIGNFWYNFLNTNEKLPQINFFKHSYHSEEFRMKNNDSAKNAFKDLQVNAAHSKPAAPFAARQAFTDRRAPDPSSVLRSDRYPIPSFFEYRMRVS